MKKLKTSKNISIKFLQCLKIFAVSAVSIQALQLQGVYKYNVDEGASSTQQPLWYSLLCALCKRR